MLDKPISVFISYSRSDSEFVDRLEADLQARKFRTWVDRRKLEGGQNWLDELEKAIEQSDTLLVILSPEAVGSDYVRMEYRFARHLGKLVIPLEYRNCPRVPIDLNGTQWVNFQSIYEQGLKDLLIALSAIETANLIPHPSSIQTKDISVRFNLQADEPDFVPPKPAPLPPEPNLNNLYKAGVTAKAEGDLERAVTLWQQILDRDHQFGNGILLVQMGELIQELHPIRMQRLRERAKQAHRSGEWGQEIGAWEALLALEPRDREALKWIEKAEHNQQYAWMYENALHFAKEGNKSAARTQLEMLWKYMPSYGDPSELAQHLGMEYQNICPTCNSLMLSNAYYCRYCGTQLR